MKHRAGLDRSQTLLFPERLEDYIGAENPVRFLDAFVGSLDLAALKFAKAQCAATGRPPYAPAVLLKLYLYGYLHRVRSSRLLEAECHRNVEVIWLTGRQTPDFKTIADFRKDNLQPLKAAARQQDVSAQIPLHTEQGQPQHHAGRPRSLDGSDGRTDEATAGEVQIKEDAGGTSVWDDQAVDELYAFEFEGIEESQHGMEPGDARLQS